MVSLYNGQNGNDEQTQEDQGPQEETLDEENEMKFTVHFQKSSQTRKFQKSGDRALRPRTKMTQEMEFQWNPISLCISA